MNIKTLLLLGAALALTFTTVHAALPPLAPDELDNSATLIITGVANELDVSTSGGRKDSNWIASIDATIESVAKGDAKPGETIEIACWRVRSRPNGWAGPSGHYDIPAKGSRFRMWLRKNAAGAWEPLTPNGIELLDDDPGHSFGGSEKPSFLRRLFGN